MSDDATGAEPVLGLGDASLQVSHLLAVGQHRRAQELALQLEDKGYEQFGWSDAEVAKKPA